MTSNRLTWTIDDERDKDPSGRCTGNRPQWATDDNDYVREDDLNGPLIIAAAFDYDRRVTTTKAGTEQRRIGSAGLSGTNRNGWHKQNDDDNQSVARAGEKDELTVFKNGRLVRRKQRKIIEYRRRLGDYRLLGAGRRASW